MFKESPEGQTHSYNDGCGELEHNNLKTILESFNELQFTTCPTEEKPPFYWRWTDEAKETFKNFLTSAIKEALESVVPEKLKRLPKEQFLDLAEQRVIGFNSAILEMKSNIDKFIK